MPRAARADGGIPGSLGILLPADQPRKIGLATTFGLILSDDAGATWSWTCEQPATSMANMYAVGPPALASGGQSGGQSGRFYALSPLQGLAFSNDESCTWTAAAGLAPGSVSDFFVDPTDARHVLAVAAAVADGGLAGGAGVFVSTDGGATFGPTPLYAAPAGAAIVGVEIARSDPRVIYVATYTTTAGAPAPVLARSADGGGSWTTTPLSAVGPAIVRILAVDPQDSGVVYLRVIAAGGDAVAVARNGGGSFSVPVTFPGGQLSAFARLGSGTVLVGALIGTDGGGTEGTAARSTDGGSTFRPWTLPAPAHLVGLAERVENGRARLYLSGKNYSDGWALAVSDDEGATLTTLMTYDQVKGMKSCVQQTCADTCRFENTQGIWDLSICGGVTGTGGAAGNTGGSGSGCGCGIDPSPARSTRFAAAVGLASLLTLVRMRRRR